jgi:hypothetical protein
MRIVGIDPGLYGASAMVDINDGGSLWLVDILDATTHGDGANERVNILIVRDWLAKHSPDHALIEGASSMPRQSIASTFKYARAAWQFGSRCCVQRHSLQHYPTGGMEGTLSFTRQG